MKYLLLFVLTALTLNVSIFAQAVDQKTATTVGARFMMEKMYLSDKGIDFAKQDIQNVYSQGQSAYYIINYVLMNHIQINE